MLDYFWEDQKYNLIMEITNNAFDLKYYMQLTTAFFRQIANEAVMKVK